MRSPEIPHSMILRELARDWKIDFISREELPSALYALSCARKGLADEVSPTCLVPVGRKATPPFSPISCGEAADRGSHSIQHHGPLSEISTLRPSGRQVLRLFPDIQHMIPLTKGEEGRVATRWPWDVPDVPPREIPISQASVSHFACGDDDQDPGRLGKADNLRLPRLVEPVYFDDRWVPADFAGVSEPLFYLAYRTLLFRISQFRAIEKELYRAYGGFAGTENRFSVQSCLDQLKQVSGVLSVLFQYKDGFDRRILGERGRMRLVHHVVPFEPVVRYVASEFMQLEHIGYCGCDRDWVSLNVLAISGRSWLIVSHRPLDNRHHSSLLRNAVLNLASSGSVKRRELDYKALSSCVNLYVCPEEYYSLPESDRALVESRITWEVCEEPFKKALDILRSSDAGRMEVERVERLIRDRA